MKNEIKLLFAATAAIIYCACNSSNDGKTSKSALKSTTNASAAAAPLDQDCYYYVDSLIADTMIVKYLTGFYLHERRLPTKFDIPLCALRDIFSFWDNGKNSDFDGVRFWFGADKSDGYRALLFVVPTKGTGAPGSQDHTNEWDTQIPSSCNSGDLMMNVPEAVALNYRDDFGTEYRHEKKKGDRTTATIDTLSIGVWMKKCKVEQLLKLYDGSTANGLRAICASYYKSDDQYLRRERKNPVQTTLLFVPTKDGKEQWELVQPEHPFTGGGGFNHGQLCPEICE